MATAGWEEKIRKKHFSALTVFHTTLVVGALITPVLFDRRIIIGFAAFYYLQLLLFGSCVLTKLDFDLHSNDVTFTHFLLHKMWFRPERKTVKKIVIIAPPFLVFLAYILQAYLGFTPFII